MEGYANKSSDAEGMEKFRAEDQRGPKKKCCGPTCLGVVIIVLVVIILILFIGLLTEGFGLWKGSPVCKTRGCAKASARVVDYMDNTIKPCDDFYKYACGGFIKKHVLDQSTGELGSITKIGEQLKVQMKTLLENPSSIDNLNVVKQAKILYRSCMNETTIDLLGVKPLKDLIDKIGGWAPLTSQWNEANFDLENYIYQMDDIVPELIVQAPSNNPHNTAQLIIFVTQGKTTVPSYVYSSKDFLKLYEETLIALATSLGGDANTIKTEIPKMIAFETELANITVTSKSQIPTPEDIMSLEQSVKEFPGINMQRLLTGIYGRLNIQLNATNLVYFMHRSYMKKMGALLNKTDKRTIASYTAFSAFRDTIPYLNNKTQILYAKLNEHYTGVKSEKARYITCADTVNKFLPFALTRLYVDENFKDGTADINNMAANLREAFIERLAGKDWLDDTSRKGAEAKAKSMLQLMGYPEHIMNNEKLDEETKITDMKEDSYFNNAVKLPAEKNVKTMKKLVLPLDRSEWEYGTPLEVNAYYYPLLNNIIFLVGILQVPFYDPSGPKSINYGGIGSIIGHEITHGFDSKGRAYDKDGNVKEWMTQSSVDNFNSKAKCIEEQFSGIVMEDLGIKVNGKQTLGENIADAGAIKQAFRAYQKWVDKNGSEKPLPGLEDLTSDQLFFVGFAQTYCRITNKIYLSMLAQLDTHTQHKERVFGILINSEEFSESFKCPSGSRMNPSKKCSVW